MRARVLAGALLTAVLALSGHAQAPRTLPADEWPMYRHDLAGTGYSPLTQITTRNVANLTTAWTYRLQGSAPAPGIATGKGEAAAEVVKNATPFVKEMAMLDAFTPTSIFVAVRSASTLKRASFSSLLTRPVSRIGNAPVSAVPRSMPSRARVVSSSVACSRTSASGSTLSLRYST